MWRGFFPHLCKLFALLNVESWEKLDDLSSFLAWEINYYPKGRVIMTLLEVIVRWGWPGTLISTQRLRKETTVSGVNDETGDLLHQ